MRVDRTTRVASLIVVGTGALWGFYWLPVRHLAASGLPGASGTLAITVAAAVLLAPMARRRRLAAAHPVAIVAIALGGAAFTLYSVGFVYGRVAIVILLFFLTPVWSTLIGRYVMGWPTPPLRLAAIAVGLTGLAVMLGADGEMPLPVGAGEWLALLSGLLWSIATTAIRARSDLAPVEAAFVFAVGAAVAALVLVPFLAPSPPAVAAAGVTVDRVALTVAWAVAAGGLWWGLSIASLMWATLRLEPARVGLLLMMEVLVGAVSAAVIAGELLGPMELLGGSLVLAAGVLEMWPLRRRVRPPSA